MGLFKKRGAPDRAGDSSRVSKAAPQSTDDWLSSMGRAYNASPAGQADKAASDKKAAMRDWHNNNAKVRDKLSTDAEYKRMDDNVAQRKRDTEIARKNPPLNGPSGSDLREAW